MIDEVKNEQGVTMKDTISTHLDMIRKHLQSISLAVFFFTFFIPAQNIHAFNLDACMLEALKYAEDSVTVGQLREQCREESGTIATTAASSQDSSSADMSPTGPEEMVLKTSQARKPAYFPHKRHQDKYYCETCHHGEDASGKLVKYTDKMVVEKCTACHNVDMPNKELNGFQLIGHKLCRECHRKHQDITSAKCSTCHRKNL